MSGTNGLVKQKKLPDFRIISPSGKEFYFCKPCFSYLPAEHFFSSYISRRFRYCKCCISKSLSERPVLNKLAKKLYKDLYNRNDKGLAQLVTVDGVKKLLDYYQVSANDVLKIEVPNKIDELLDFKYYKVIKL